MRRMRAQPLLRQSVPSHTMPSWGPEIYEARYTRPRGNTLKVAGVSRYISSAMLWFLADGKSLNVCSCSAN